MVFKKCDFVTDPDSNTGSDSQTEQPATALIEARIDALTIIWTKGKNDDIDKVLQQRLGVSIDRSHSTPRVIGVLWDKNYTSPTGTLLSERYCENGRISCRLAVSGQDCGRNGNLRVAAFLRWALMYLSFCRCTRIDAFIDDYSKKLQFHDIENAINNKQGVGFRKGKVHRDYGGKYEGWTCYMGRRQSEKLYRAYDKFAESKGEIDAHRLEVENKDSRAQAVAALILEFPQDNEIFQKELVKIIVGGISFVEKIDKNISRCPLLKWWEEFLEYLETVPFKVFVPRIKTSIAKTKQWIQRNVAKSMAILEVCLGTYYFPHFIKEILASGHSRIKDIDRLKIQDYISNFESIADTMPVIKINLQGV